MYILRWNMQSDKYDLPFTYPFYVLYKERMKTWEYQMNEWMNEWMNECMSVHYLSITSKTYTCEQSIRR
jgi:hypothetical protein